MATLTQTTDPALAHYASFRAAAPAWLRPAREAAMRRFLSLGFPTTKDEEWAFTNVDVLRRTLFQPAGREPATVTSRDVEKATIHGLGKAQLVFVDGQFDAKLSALSGLPWGVEAGSLARALDERHPAAEKLLSQRGDPDVEAFTALNLALTADGGFVHVPEGVVVDVPIHIIFLTTPTSEPTMTHPRNVIVAGARSQLTVLEDYVSLGDGPAFTNAVTDVSVGESAVIEHYLLERENEAAVNVSSLDVHQGRASTFASHSIIAGGGLVRNNVHPVLDGEGCSSLLNGLFITRGRQHVDNHMRVEHVAPHCDSRQFYKGILDGESRGVFAGRIHVHAGAQKTDAKQTNMNLLLSDSAQVDTKPQLEIYADDVKCTHGATIGQVDEDAIFYLRTRGLSEPIARSLLVVAFARESLARMKLAPVREHVEGLVAERIPHGTELARGVFA